MIDCFLLQHPDVCESVPSQTVVSDKIYALMTFVGFYCIFSAAHTCFYVTATHLGEENTSQTFQYIS